MARRKKNGIDKARPQARAAARRIFPYFTAATFDLQQAIITQLEGLYFEGYGAALDDLKGNAEKLHIHRGTRRRLFGEVK